jgi:hypothetical protein
MVRFSVEKFTPSFIGSLPSIAKYSGIKFFSKPIYFPAPQENTSLFLFIFLFKISIGNALARRDYGTAELHHLQQHLQVHHLQWQGNPQLQQQGIIPVHRIPYTKQPPEEIRSGCFAFYIIYHNSSLEMSDEPYRLTRKSPWIES